MNKLLKLLILCVVYLFSACSSNDDVLEPEYTGPWRIAYEELFYGWSTNNPKFKEWFEEHLQDFKEAEFRDASGSNRVIYSKENGDWIEWQDYKTWYQGTIIWCEEVEYATETEIKAKVDEFESFTSYNDDKGHRVGDDFRAQYKKMK